MRTLTTLRYMEQEVPCVTIAKIQRLLNVSWSAARHILKQLVRHRLVIEIRLGRKMLWCISEEAAATEVHAIRHALWLVLCQYRRRFVTPTTVAKLIAKNTEARNVFAKYVEISDRNVDTLRFIAAALEDMLGPPIDKRPRKTTYHVPTETLCVKEPEPGNVLIKRYKSPNYLVSIRVPTPMYNHLLEVANRYGITMSQVVRMAISNLLEKYRHVLEDGKYTNSDKSQCRQCNKRNC